MDCVPYPSHKQEICRCLILNTINFKCYYLDHLFHHASLSSFCLYILLFIGFIFFLSYFFKHTIKFTIFLLPQMYSICLKNRKLTLNANGYLISTHTLLHIQLPFSMSLSNYNFTKTKTI